MSEPKELSAARARLAKADSTLGSSEALQHLREGLALLEDVVDRRPPAGGERVAGNIAATYTTRIYERVRQRLAAERNMPEPELEHLFAVIRAFDDAPFDLPEDAPALKVELARRLIECYYEGHGAADKQRAHERLAEIANASSDSDRRIDEGGS